MWPATSQVCPAFSWQASFQARLGALSLQTSNDLFTVTCSNVFVAFSLKFFSSSAGTAQLAIFFLFSTISTINKFFPPQHNQHRAERLGSNCAQVGTILAKRQKIFPKLFANVFERYSKTYLKYILLMLIATRDFMPAKMREAMPDTRQVDQNNVWVLKRISVGCS